MRKTVRANGYYRMETFLRTNSAILIRTAVRQLSKFHKQAIACIWKNRRIRA